MGAVFNGTRKFRDDECFIVSKANKEHCLHPEEKKSNRYVLINGYEGAAIFTKNIARRFLTQTGNSGRLTWLTCKEALNIK